MTSTQPAISMVAARPVVAVVLHNVEDDDDKSAGRAADLVAAARPSRAMKNPATMAV